ncbi:uncharacterized protein E5676_scaffold352G00720 [Cucumis melo var. makuwa]|uniref:DUF3741 domain-containing protein n=3 Tax=Cucumis melo TaxID=3656 RepID=A0A5D3DMU1_CUCMM|nr:hypothetical protein [Cucumis melo subsp. melo]ADN34274.1 hypothetical protein [Cucumis melo subsp. melo]KAA0044177.1 uncharacterized protein E6C27_scaffold236G005350 [Cucumis melo var. makuwa]TYK24956.1 uncharacterized protein E5676_scaffold352G00720 [Cucumis melo var. makuwa]
MPNSAHPNSGCFSGILRRLLCTGNLPTHPSEALHESQFDIPKTEAKLAAQSAESTPGVVARLMGLSSLPDANWVPNHQVRPGAVSRSKSVNFADYLLDFDSNQSHHRRIRTSASFREVPPLNPHNDFFVLYTKDCFNGYGIESNLKKPETQRFDEGKQSSNDLKKKKKKKENARNEMKISKLKDEPRRVSRKNFTESKKCSMGKDSFSVLPSCKHKCKRSIPRNESAVIQKKPTMQKEATIRTELNKKKKKNVRHVERKPDLQLDSENSSPVSVLDVGRIEFSDERQIGGKNRVYDYGELVERICRLAEEDIEAKWTAEIKNADKSEALEEICMEIERHVVDALLVHTLNEFANL